MELISKGDAKERGLGWYYTGQPCGRGHVIDRKVSTGDCRQCLRDRQRAWAVKNMETVCQKSREWYAANTERAAATRAAWRAANPDKVRADVARYQAENADRLKAAAKIWQQANPEKVSAKARRYRERNPERVLQSGSQWRKQNRAKVNAKKSRRIASQLRATPAWADRMAITAIYAEAQRLTELTGIPHHVDHVVPIRSDIVCGLHCEANLQVLPARLNQSKSNRVWPDMPGSP